jgi:hypothetical protein
VILKVKSIVNAFGSSPILSFASLIWLIFVVKHPTYENSLTHYGLDGLNV